MNKNKWIIDTGASEHVIGNKDYLVDYVDIQQAKYVIVEDGRKLKIVGKGNIEVFSKANSELIPTTFYNVLYIPYLKASLFSVSCALDKGYVMTRNIYESVFTKIGKVAATAIRQENFVCKQKGSDSSYVLSLMTWHKRLDHHNFDYVKEVLKASNIKYKCENEKELCKDCR